jgi:hypothetical protein
VRRFEEHLFSTYADIWTVAKKKTMFDDRPVEINEVRSSPGNPGRHTTIAVYTGCSDANIQGQLTFIIKKDLSALNVEISKLQALSRVSLLWLGYWA